MYLPILDRIEGLILVQEAEDRSTKHLVMSEVMYSVFEFEVFESTGMNIESLKKQDSTLVRYKGMDRITRYKGMEVIILDRIDEFIVVG